jgi:hypothetical protein
MSLFYKSVIFKICRYKRLLKEEMFYNIIILLNRLIKAQKVFCFNRLKDVEQIDESKYKVLLRDIDSGIDSILGYDDL